MSSPVEVDDFDALLEAARNGDKEAQGRLLETCRRSLLRLARRGLNPSLLPKGGASDVVQETFLKALHEIDAFQGCTPEQLLAWLRVILLNTLSNFARQFQTAKRQMGREGATYSRSHPAHPAPPPSEVVIRREQARLLRQVLGRLPDHYAEVVRLRHEERLSFEEIGRRTGRSGQAARKLWLRAVEEMGWRLQGHS